MTNSRSDPRGALVLAMLLLATLAGLAQSPGSGGVNRAEHLDKPYVVLVSVDGFKPEYLERFEVRNIRRVVERGVRAGWMRPVFPTLTFPNHYSLVTGMYPSRHGLVSNRFYDPLLKDTYFYNDDTAAVDGKWYGGEPIWVTAETQGMVSACYFWPGSEAPIKGVRPTIHTPYSTEVPNDDRVGTVLEWLRMPRESRPHLITLYFSEVDNASHEVPLASPEVEKAVLSIDRTIGRLVDGIDALPIRDKVYLVLTSDHGMAETGRERTLQLSSLLNDEDIAQLAFAESGPVVNLHVMGGASRATEFRDRINTRITHGRAYLRDKVPERFHYRGNSRIGDVVIVMDEGWSISSPRVPRPPPPPPGASERPSRTRAARDVWGAHGWDPELPSMRALFVAMGPTIPAGITLDEIHNIDVYPFIAEVLGLRPAANIDGRAGRIRALLPKARGAKVPAPE